MGNCAGREEISSTVNTTDIKKPSQRKPSYSKGRAKEPVDRNLYVAKYDYECRTQGDISFRQGDKFEVLQKNGDWWFARHLATKTEGFIPFNYVVEYTSIESEPWYFGKIRRAPAESRLLSNQNPQGAFLIRVSESRNNEYSLSVKDGRTVKHYLIRRAEIQEGRGAVYFIARRTPFDTMRELIEHYQCDSDGLCTNLTQPCIRDDDDDITPYSISPYDRWEIDRTSLKFQEKLGHGHFGDVYRGLWNEKTPVAIKSLKPDSMSVEDFLKEAQCLKKLHHPKLIKLYAVCTKEEPILIVTELMANGSLLHYLQGRGKNATIRDMVNFGAQVASGMSYLEVRNLIHRDLAARNVLVGKKGCVKVADFGLARMLDGGVYNPNTNQRVPVKWTAPEAFLYQQFSTKSDVWSFGILMIEITTRGRTPYPGMSNKEVMEAVGDKGYRMPRPDGCPEKLYEIIKETWRTEPQERPTFETLEWSLDDYFINEGSEYRENVT